MANQQHYQSPFGDTSSTKVFVGGLAWETPNHVMTSYFEQFGEILEAVIINDKNTGKSKGYGFVTFRDPESAERACADPNPVIGGRRANCNIASLGLPRPSPSRGRNEVGVLYPGSGTPAQGASTFYRSLPPPSPPTAPPSVIYPAYGYTAYPPDYNYHQPMYNPHLQQTQYYNQVYGAPSSTMGAPYYYGYSMQTPRGTFPIPPTQRVPYFYYRPTQQVDYSTSSYAPPRPHISSGQSMRLPFPPSIGAPQTSTETEAGPPTSTS